jgi:hypothetical protein
MNEILDDKIIENDLRHIKFLSTVYKRKLLIELYAPQKYISPGVYTIEHDFSVISYDLVANPSSHDATIGIGSRAMGPINEPIEVESAEQMRNVFGDL